MAKVQDQDHREEKEEALQKDSVGIVPLGIPCSRAGGHHTVMNLVSDALVTSEAIGRRR
jgi:small neutral amino acid transporter SnatA (MarC family)